MKMMTQVNLSERISHDAGGCLTGRFPAILSVCASIALLLAWPVFGVSVVVDPYADVDWDAFEQHKANLHTHTTQSDGRGTPNEVVDEYHRRGYTILALTDHNLCTWPWTEFGSMERKGRALMGDNAAEREPDVPSEERRNPEIPAYEDRDPETLGMLAIAGNEPSIHHHCCTFFVEYETRSRELEQTIEEVAALGGLVMINHPGRYWDRNDDGAIPNEVVTRYTTLFQNYDNVVGVEVINQGQRYKYDIHLWDRILAELMPEEPVWGFSNDDMHSLDRLGRDWNVFVVESLDEAQIRAAMESGQFYFSTVGTHPDDVRNVEQTPVINAITHDEEAGTLFIDASSGGVPLPEEQHRWISDNGVVVHTGATLNYRETAGIGVYVRAEMMGSGGTTFTNPFGISAN